MIVPTNLVGCGDQSVCLVAGRLVANPNMVFGPVMVDAEVTQVYCTMIALYNTLVV